MSKKQIIKAWTDEEYRDSLSENERAALPENPAGLIALDDGDLDAIAGGTTLECFVDVTSLFSCGPTCMNTFINGSCPFGTTGCC